MENVLIKIFLNQDEIFDGAVPLGNLNYQFILETVNIHSPDDLYQYRIHLPNDHFFNLGELLENNRLRMVEDLEPYLHNRDAAIRINPPYEFRIMNVEFRDPTELLPRNLALEDDNML
mmetsp:Transcript_28035/g.38587  ORF Transcript_28035/g.38587 Transcript_28035/m.38587 type:complete len:118 (-) Transcript_28035:157-510(-)